MRTVAVALCLFVVLVVAGAGTQEDAVVPESVLATSATHDINDDDFDDDAGDEGDLLGPKDEIEDEREHPDDYIPPNDDEEPESYDSTDSYVTPHGHYNDVPESGNRRRVGSGYHAYHKHVDVIGYKALPEDGPDGEDNKIFNGEKIDPITPADRDDKEDMQNHEILGNSKEQKDMEEATHIVSGHDEYTSGGHETFVIDHKEVVQMKELY